MVSCECISIYITHCVTRADGRVELHIVYELITDLSGFAAYNSTTQRFIRTAASTAFREPLKRVSAPKNKARHPPQPSLQPHPAPMLILTSLEP